MNEVTTSKALDDYVDTHFRCANCIHFRATTLFDGTCGRDNLNVHAISGCEFLEFNDPRIDIEIKRLQEAWYNEYIKEYPDNE